jgi:hypothetical protein
MLLRNSIREISIVFFVATLSLTHYPPSMVQSSQRKYFLFTVVGNPTSRSTGNPRPHSPAEEACVPDLKMVPRLGPISHR